MGKSIFDSVWESFGEKKPEGLELELFNFLKEKNPEVFEGWESEEIVKLIQNWNQVMSSRSWSHKAGSLDVSEVFQINSLLKSFKEHIRKLCPQGEDEDFSIYLQRVNLILKTEDSEKGKEPKMEGESEDNYQKRILEKVKSKCQKLSEMERERIEIRLTGKLNELKKEHPDVFKNAHLYSIDYTSPLDNSIITLQSPDWDYGFEGPYRGDKVEFSLEEFLGN